MFNKLKKFKLLGLMLSVSLTLSSICNGQLRSDDARRVASIRYNAHQFNKARTQQGRDRRGTRILNTASGIRTPRGVSSARRALEKKGISGTELKESAFRNTQFLLFKEAVDRFVQRRRSPRRTRRAAMRVVAAYRQLSPAYERDAQKYLAKYRLTLPVLGAIAGMSTTPVVPQRTPSPAEARQTAQREALQVRKDVGQLQAQVGEVEGKVNKLLSQPTTTFTLDEVKSIVTKAVAGLQKKLVDLEARVADQEALVDPSLDYEKERLEAEASQFADVKKLIDLIEKADALMLRKINSRRAAQAESIRSDLNDALGDYKDTPNSNPTIMSAAQNRIVGLSAFIGKLSVPEKPEPVTTNAVSMHELRSAIDFADQVLGKGVPIAYLESVEERLTNELTVIDEAIADNKQGIDYAMIADGRLKLAQVANELAARAAAKPLLLPIKSEPSKTPAPRQSSLKPLSPLAESVKNLTDLANVMLAGGATQYLGGLKADLQKNLTDLQNEPRPDKDVVDGAQDAINRIEAKLNAPVLSGNVQRVDEPTMDFYVKSVVDATNYANSLNAYDSYKDLAGAIASLKGAIEHLETAAAAQKVAVDQTVVDNAQGAIGRLIAVERQKSAPI